MFKTIEAFGVMMYGCGEQGDFILLELKRGKVVYTANFGSTEEESGIHTIVLDKQYNDNKWHRLNLVRENGTHVQLTIDHDTKLLNSELQFQQLNLDNFLYIGGVGNSERFGKNRCYNVTRIKNYIGCLSNVLFNSNGLLYGASEKFTGFQTFGNMMFTCPTKKYDIIGLSKYSSYLDVKRNLLNRNELSLTIELRTFEPNGHIATQKCTDGGIEVDVRQGKVEVTLSFSSLSKKNAISIPSSQKIDDGNWHTVKLVIKRKESLVMLKIDQVKKTYQAPPHFNFTSELGWFMEVIRFGGNTPELPSLITCFRIIQNDEKIITLNSTNVKSAHDVSDHCKTKDACFPNPCQHDSTCTQSMGKAICNCNNTGYIGATCNICRYKRTCQEYKDAGEGVSKMYKLCSTNERIFEAYCDIKTGATIINHSTKNETALEDAKTHHLLENSLYEIDYEYPVAIDSIIDLMGVSTHCEQYVRYDCFKSKLLGGVGRRRYVDYKGVRWLSRDYDIQHYWGGASPDSRKCGCAMDNSCARDRFGYMKYCNCDMFDSKWRSDSGFLKDKAKLPVSQITVSRGPETNENSMITVGALQCYGSVPKPTSPMLASTSSTNSILPSVHPSMIDPFIVNRTRDTVSINKSGNTKPTEVSSQTVLVEKVQAESIDSLFSKPWLITILVVGVLLCLLLVLLVFLLFRQQISDIFMKCVYGSHVTKPRIEIEDYNRYSTATEDQSDWDIYRLSTTFPTSTPEPSYGPTDDESVGIRVRTLEDLRGKRRFKRLTGWGSRTASAPTVVGSNSKQSISDKIDDFGYQKCKASASSSQPYRTSTDSRNNESLHTLESLDTDPAYSTTATDGEADSVIDTNSEFSHKSQNSSMKESECTVTPPSTLRVKKTSKEERPKTLCKNGGVFNKDSATTLTNGPVIFTDPVKAYYPILPLNGFRQPVIRRAHPAEYGPHVTMVNNSSGRCQHSNGSVARLLPVNRRTSVTSDSYPLYAHPTIQERAEDTSDDDEDKVSYENARNSDGFYELYEHGEHGSPNSETRLIFDDLSSREECEREADERIKLLKKKVIEKATSADECA